MNLWEELASSLSPPDVIIKILHLLVSGISSRYLDW